MKNSILFAAKLALALLIVSGCTKSRRAELPEDQQAGIFAISEFGETTSNSSFNAEISTASAHLLASDVSVPARMKFMFSNLPLLQQDSKKFKITFSVDREFVTAYKVADKVSELSTLEKAIATTMKEVQLIARAGQATTGQMQQLQADTAQALADKELVKSGAKEGALLVPLFKYSVESYGVVVRSKNEMKEETSTLELKSSEWKDATHIKLSAQTDARKVVGMSVEQADQLRQLYQENQVNNQLMSAAELQSRFSIGMNFIDPKAQVFTRLDANAMHVYEVTSKDKLNDLQRRLLQNGNQEIMSCQDLSVAKFINSTDPNCVIVLKADVPVSYKTAKLKPTDPSGRAAPSIEFEEVGSAHSVGLVEIKQNAAAKQVDISGALDPASTVKLSDLQGEFFYRRTFESASNMFMGRTGTSGDMTIVKFELEDSRLVVRNQQSLITYTGQGAKDREELMSFPVKYIRMATTDASGAKLTVPQAEQTTKEKAEYASIDWTANTVPDAHSPLAFYAGGKCFHSNSSLQVTDTDMRLNKDGVLNYSLSGSYTVEASPSCVAEKEVNSMYWGGTYQFNFNVKERISFLKKTDAQADVQFSQNISGMAQAAFNYGVFTLADKVTDNDTLSNRDGSEKYMPLIHDFRNGKKITYHVGGLNNSEATPPARRALMVEATKEVIAEWNRTLRLAFKGTPLERSGDYVDVEFDNSDNDGHLGDLDRNYIWYNELPAENGLLGVAQPAANPRSGTIQAANVIIYSGNTMNQTVQLLKMTALGREYEKFMEDQKTKALAKLNAPPPKTPEAKAAAAAKVGSSILRKALHAMQSTNPAIVISPEEFRSEGSKGKSIGLPDSQETYLQKLMEVSARTKDPKILELEMNRLFTTYGNLDKKTKAALQKRSDLLSAAARFDEANANRPGCISYARNDINDEALTLSEDPEENKMLNFRKNIKATLSHELGHAFGLLHNFKASIDAANYEFPEDKETPTGRNYSSIMDYMADIDMNYRGPGPYDAHALRAAYTGMVETKAGDSLVSIDSVMKSLEKNSLVHFTKRTVNPRGTLKYYEQCDDSGLQESSLCAQFDSGGTAAQIVKTLIQDYNRSYKTRNYVYDKINFAGEQKQQILLRNLSLFQKIRSFLDEAVMAKYFDNGLPKVENDILKQDLAEAAKTGYMFFHELLRTPDAPDVSAMDPNVNRFIAVPFEYLTTTGKAKDVRVLEARSLDDVPLTSDKIDTVGIAYDKMFAMSFLLQSTATKTTDDSRPSFISYLGFERMFLGVRSPSQSMIMHTILDVLSNNLTVGFFKPQRGVVDMQFLQSDSPVEINRLLRDRTSLATIVGLEQSKWAAFDPFAEAFKVSKATLSAAPQDRPSVAKSGQDRDLSDTKLMFASQNAVGAQTLVNVAASNETYVIGKKFLYPAMDALAKPDADPSVVAELVKKLRDMNGMGLIIPPELDKEDSEENLDVQVAQLQTFLQKQAPKLNEYIETLKNTKLADLNAAIAKIRNEAGPLKESNDELLGTPLMAIAYSYLVNSVSEIVISPSDNKNVKISAQTIAGWLVSPGRVESDLRSQQEVLERLADFTGLVDPDTVGR